MAPFKLAKLPDRKTTKITFMASANLNELLTDYADAYEAKYGQEETVADLIPHILETFIKADRGFKRKCNNSETSQSTALKND